jgi:hypothetical protein
MSPLFRKRKKKAAREVAASAELNRLRGLEVDELAASFVPALRRFIRPENICKWLMRSHPDGLETGSIQLLQVVRAALLQLERAELVCSTPPERPAMWKLTGLGQVALAEGTVAQYLGQRAFVVSREPWLPEDAVVAARPTGDADPARHLFGAVGAVARCPAATSAATSSALV